MTEVRMDDMKLVVKELNERLNKKLNVISYDNLRGEQRLEILLQVFKEIDPSINLESFEVADPEEVVVRVLELLRIFKYQPPASVEPSTFRAGIIEGDKSVLTHCLSYLLSRLDELRKRAYLARFLVKIEVSPDVEGDNDIVQLYQQYEGLIESFKVAHTGRESLKRSTRSVQEIQKDIRTMEEEKEQVSQKLSNTKRKVDASSNSELFQLVTTYREEKEKNEKMTQQSAQQEAEVQHLSQRLARVVSALKETQATYQTGSSTNSSGVGEPSDVLEKMGQEIDAKRHLTREILPKELSLAERYLADLREIDGQASLGPEYLDKINQSMQAMSREINATLEKKMLREDPMDDKLVLFRQNAATVAKKRETVKAKLTETERQLSGLREQLNEKKAAFDGEQILKGDALKQYVTSIRNKGNVYKRKKTELAELRTESGLKARTVEVLQGKERQMMEILVDREEQRGISGYFSMQEQQQLNNDQETAMSAMAQLAAFQGLGNAQESIEQLTKAIRALNEDITQKKAQLAPVIKDLRPLRQQCQDLQFECDQKKATYDSTAAGLESSLSKLEQEVKKLDLDASKLESAEYRSRCELEVALAYEELLAREMQCFVSTDGEDKSKSFQEKMKKELFEEQLRSEELKAKQQSFKANEAASKRQVKLWKDLQTLLEMKKVCLERQLQDRQDRKQMTKMNHLIL